MKMQEQVKAFTMLKEFNSFVVTMDCDKYETAEELLEEALEIFLSLKGFDRRYKDTVKEFIQKSA